MTNRKPTKTAALSDHAKQHTPMPNELTPENARAQLLPHAALATLKYDVAAAMTSFDQSENR